MSGINITRDEAQQRSATVAVESYEVQVDLTGRHETFPSTTTVRFSARPGGATWIDYVAPTVSAIRFEAFVGDWAVHDFGTHDAATSAPPSAAPSTWKA